MLICLHPSTVCLSDNEFAIPSGEQDPEGKFREAQSTRSLSRDGQLKGYTYRGDSFTGTRVDPEVENLFWRGTGREEKPEALLVFLKLVMMIASCLTHLTVHDLIK